MVQGAKRLAIFIGLMLGAVGCLSGGTNRSEQPLPVVHPWPREGQLGVVFRQGVECLGQEAQPRPGDVLYVSPQGSDDNPGSRQAPLQTLASALCHARPGQTIYLLPGVYSESVLLGAFGAEEAPIVLKGVVENGQWPILDGGNERSMGLALVECSNFVIEGIEFRHYTDEGLLVLLGENIVIRGNRFVANGRASVDPDADGEGFGLNLLGVQQAVVEANQVIANGPAEERRQQYVLGTGINTYEVFETVIRDNYIVNTIGGGILVEDGGNVLLEGNVIAENELDANGDYWDGGIWVDGSHDVIVRGNKLQDNHGPAIVISDEERQYPRSSYAILVTENQASGNLVAVFMWNYGLCPPPAEAVQLYDNDFYDNEISGYWCEE